MPAPTITPPLVTVTLTLQLQLPLSSEGTRRATRSQDFQGQRLEFRICTVAALPVRRVE